MDESVMQRMTALFEEMSEDEARQLLDEWETEGWSLDQEESAHAVLSPALQGPSMDAGVPAFDIPPAVEDLLEEARESVGEETEDGEGSLEDVFAGDGGGEGSVIRPGDFQDETGTENAAGGAGGPPDGVADVMSSILAAGAPSKDASESPESPGLSDEVSEEELPEDLTDS